MTNTNPWHYDRTRMLSQLGTGFSPGFPTGTARPRLNVTPLVPDLATGSRHHLWSRLVLASGTKITPFCSFPYFPFDSFLFISILLLYWNSWRVWTPYIYLFIIFVLNIYHIYRNSHMQMWISIYMVNIKDKYYINKSLSLYRYIWSSYIYIGMHRYA